MSVYNLVFQVCQVHYYLLSTLQNLIPLVSSFTLFILRIYATPLSAFTVFLCEEIEQDKN